MAQSSQADFVPSQLSAVFGCERMLLCMRGTKTFIREWRRAKGLTLVQLAERIGITHGQLSKVERGLRPYSQLLLEALARELGTDPASLLMRNPTDPDGIWSIWDQVPPTERPRAITILKALTRTGT
jgi:transcriptional regulator with XRE-family HTH domain